MGRPFVEFVHSKKPEQAKYVCQNCGCDVASEAELVWEGFMNVSTPAFLFRHAVNTATASAPRREALSTGTYDILDLRCRACAVSLGWQYLWAERPEQKYKEGSMLLHQHSLLRVTGKRAAATAEEAPPQAPRH